MTLCIDQRKTQNEKCDEEFALYCYINGMESWNPKNLNSQSSSQEPAPLCPQSNQALCSSILFLFPLIPQIYNPDFLHYFLSIFDLFQSPDYALFFNSYALLFLPPSICHQIEWLGFCEPSTCIPPSSLNHSQWHGLFIHDFIPEDTKLPIQYQSTTVLKQVYQICFLIILIDEITDHFNDQ